MCNVDSNANNLYDNKDSCPSPRWPGVEVHPVERYPTPYENRRTPPGPPFEGVVTAPFAVPPHAPFHRRGNRRRTRGDPVRPSPRVDASHRPRNGHRVCGATGGIFRRVAFHVRPGPILLVFLHPRPRRTRFGGDRLPHCAGGGGARGGG